MLKVNNTMFSFLPSNMSQLEKNHIAMIRKSFLSVEENPNYEFQKDIYKLIINRCTRSENNPLYWSISDYLTFAQGIKKIDNEGIILAKDTLIKCLCTLNEDLLKEFRVLSKKLDSYPEMIRTYIKEEVGEGENKKTQTRYEITPKKIQPLDYVYLIAMIHTDIKSLSSKKSKKILESTKEDDDIEILCETIKDTFNTGTKEQQDAFLSEFYEKFSWLENSLFHSMYEEGKNLYILLTVKNIYQLQRAADIKKAKEKELFFSVWEREKHDRLSEILKKRRGTNLRNANYRRSKGIDFIDG